MSETETRFKNAIHIFQKSGGILHMADAVSSGISRYTLYAMRDAGIIDALSRGVYRLGSTSGMAYPDLATVASRSREGVICLISALSFHEITTQIPHAVDIAIPRDAREPRIAYPPVNIYEFSKDAYSAGIECHDIDGMKVRIYSVEKSIADVFKFRNRLGMDVAIEALQLWARRSGRDLNALVGYARICRVERIMKPYLEALV